MDSPIPDRTMFTNPGLTNDGLGLGWRFGFFDFSDVAEKLIVNDPNLFWSFFNLDYAGRKKLFRDPLLNELIEPYSRVADRRATFSGYYASHPTDVAENEALLSAGKTLSIPTLVTSGSERANDVVRKQVASRFMSDPALLRLKSSTAAAVADIRRLIGANLRARIQRDVTAGVLPQDADAAALAGLVMAIIQGRSTLARDGAPGQASSASWKPRSGDGPPRRLVSKQNAVLPLISTVLGRAR